MVDPRRDETSVPPVPADAQRNSSTPTELLGIRVQYSAGRYDLGYDSGTPLTARARRALHRALRRGESIENACRRALNIELRRMEKPPSAAREMGTW